MTPGSGDMRLTHFSFLLFGVSLAIAVNDAKGRSVEVNPTHFNQEYLEFQVENGRVDVAVTICYRILFKHSGMIRASVTERLMM